jgi:multisubunit Na+/H+ antiporter MnhC subunit
MESAQRNTSRMSGNRLEVLDHGCLLTALVRSFAMKVLALAIACVLVGEQQKDISDSLTAGVQP